MKHKIFAHPSKRPEPEKVAYIDATKTPIDHRCPDLPYKCCETLFKWKIEDKSIPKERSTLLIDNQYKLYDTIANFRKGSSIGNARTEYKTLFEPSSNRNEAPKVNPTRDVSRAEPTNAPYVESRVKKEVERIEKKDQIQKEDQGSSQQQVPPKELLSQHRDPRLRYRSDQDRRRASSYDGPPRITMTPSSPTPIKFQGPSTLESADHFNIETVISTRQGAPSILNQSM